MKANITEINTHICVLKINCVCAGTASWRSKAQAARSHGRRLVRARVVQSAHCNIVLSYVKFDAMVTQDLMYKPVHIAANTVHYFRVTAI